MIHYILTCNDNENPIFNGQMITTIAFDADDTLWENEHFFKLTEKRFAELLTDFADREHLAEQLLNTERRNLKRFGYGVKGFVLSMVETAIEVTERRVSAAVIEQIIQTGYEILEHPIHILPYVPDTLASLARDYRLLLITKGDLFDQERKVALSGLSDLFDAVEIVSDKNQNVYERIFGLQADGPEKSVMVGNSIRSDILPALEAGSWGIFVPHHVSWAMEDANLPENHSKFRQIDNIGMLPELIDEINQCGN